MKIETIARELGAHVLFFPNPERNDIREVYAGDRMSDLLGASGEHTLLITHIANRGLTSLIELMDVPAVCLVNGATPEPEVMDVAQKCATAILISPWSLYETCGRLYELLSNRKQELPST